MPYTPADLHIAISFKNLESVIRIVSDSNIHDELFRGITPVSLAIKKRALNILEYLVQEGANVNIRTRDDRMEPPLFTACRLGYIEAVKILLKSSNLNVDQQDFFGRTPLWAAAGSFNFEIVELLLNKGASVNLTDNPLLQVFNKSFCDHRIARILIRRGCKLDFILNNVQNRHLLFKNIDTCTLELLLHAGCNIKGLQNYAHSQYVQNEKQLSQFIDSFIIGPKPLRHLTICFIRKLLVNYHKNISPNHVSELPLPKALKRYILLEY